MDVDLYALFGLNLLSPQKLYYLLSIISYFELFVMLIIMWRKKFFLEKMDVVFLIIAIQFILYAAFKVEHIDFFFCLLYINFFLFLIYQICKKYKK